MINIDEWNKWWVLAEQNGDTPPITETINDAKTVNATNGNEETKEV